MGRRLRRVAFAGLSLLVAAAAQAQIAVRDDRGVEHRFERSPQRIVTLLPSLTETVCALGACGRLVGTDRYSNWPASVQALPKLGGLDDALLERIVALKPEVVLAASSTRAVGRLEQLGIPVLAFDSDRHEQVRTSLQRIGSLLGTPAQAEAAWAAIEAEFASAAAAVPARLQGRTVYFEADSTPYAAGAASFVGQTLARLKLENIAPASMGAFPKLNPEFIVRSQPHVIMAVRRNADEMKGRPGWTQLQALQSGRICAFDSERYELLTRPGPRLGQAALAMAECLAALPAR
jgi:iron complex transport system substrate-binding protein